MEHTPNRRNGVQLGGRRKVLVLHGRGSDAFPRFVEDLHTKDSSASCQDAPHCPQTPGTPHQLTSTRPPSTEYLDVWVPGHLCRMHLR